jgi:hypothetical protein
VWFPLPLHPTEYYEKYHLISENMIAIVTRLEENNKTFESRIEKTEKNIESLLKILAQKKS